VRPHEAIDIRIYPNPTDGQLRIEGNGWEEGMNYRILNVFGQCVDNGVLTSNELSLARFADGIYFVQLFSKNKPVKTEKIIKK
jgi:hypothetical protein